jgi:hypothetical protein
MGADGVLSECIETLDLEPHTNHNHLYELNLFKGDLIHLCGKCMEQCGASSIHPNPLFLVLNLTQMKKKLVAYSFFWGGENLSNYERKNSKVFHHIWTWILVWRQFFKAVFATFWINSRNMLPF